MSPGDVHCATCGADRQVNALAAGISRTNAVITFLGVFVFALVALALCLVPVFVVFPLVFLLVPAYLVVGVGGGLALATNASIRCLGSGGRIPMVAHVGYGLLLLAVVATLAFRANQERIDSQDLLAAKQLYGSLYFPGALPDPRFSPAIRTSASLTEVLRFYKENPSCDSRRFYGGGGEYTVSCKLTNSGSAVRVKLASRVENNEPYVMISLEP
jgi:hypothetical protein